MASLIVEVELVDIQRIDGLCPECLLPSLIRVTMSFRNEARLVPYAIGSEVACTDCDYEEES